ncbi:hypothetical protein [Pseudonocardia sp. T1-2H]|uniref:hypothetical protein n=1 Tax=Pseudonocardia sp. T1-2H TaxID=3128899 RepID=UPI00310165CA
METASLAEVTEPLTALRAALAELRGPSRRTRARPPSPRPSTRRTRRTAAMAAVRAAADTLEGIVADDLWPLPTYQEMLFIL